MQCGQQDAAGQVDCDWIARINTMIEQNPRKTQREVPEFAVCQAFAGIDDRSLSGAPLGVGVDDVRDRLVAPYAHLTEAARRRAGLHPRNVAVDHDLAPSQTTLCT